MIELRGDAGSNPVGVFDLMHMKLQEQDRTLGGFRVSFEMLKGKMLYGMAFPLFEEVAIQTFEEALEMCQVISKLQNAYNIFPIHAVDFSPVKDFEKYILKER